VLRTSSYATGAGVEAIGDQGNQVGLQAGQSFVQPPFAARSLDGSAKRRERDGVAVDETFRNKRTQKRTRIIG